MQVNEAKRNYRSSDGLSKENLAAVQAHFKKGGLPPKAVEIYKGIMRIKKHDPGYAPQRLGGHAAATEIGWWIALQLQKKGNVSKSAIAKRVDQLIKHFDLFPEWFTEKLTELGEAMATSLKKVVKKDMGESVFLRHREYVDESLYASYFPPVGDNMGADSEKPTDGRWTVAMVRAKKSRLAPVKMKFVKNKKG